MRSEKLGAALLGLALTSQAWAQSTPTIQFPTSGAPTAQADFLRGVEALHNFEYEEANQAFVRARSADPSFAMAIWGEALTFHQTLWRNENLAAGREALARLGPSPTVRAVRIATARERGFFAAVEALLGEGDVDLRRRGSTTRLPTIPKPPRSTPSPCSGRCRAG